MSKTEIAAACGLAMTSEAFLKGFVHVCSGEGNGPACGDDYQNYQYQIADLNLSKHLVDKPKIYAEKGNKSRKKRCNSHCQA